MLLRLSSTLGSIVKEQRQSVMPSKATDMTLVTSSTFCRTRGGMHWTRAPMQSVAFEAQPRAQLRASFPSRSPRAFAAQKANKLLPHGWYQPAQRELLQGGTRLGVVLVGERREGDGRELAGLQPVHRGGVDRHCLLWRHIRAVLLTGMQQKLLSLKSCTHSRRSGNDHPDSVQCGS